MKRHERPYGCTFLTCNKIFGSKNDWKRHENSQHFHLETWRCEEQKPEGGACAKVCYRRLSFQEHLKKEHNMSNDDNIKAKLDASRIGRNGQERFWCGFCNKLVELRKKGLEAWTERFDHIDDHFMGRHNFPKQSIQDWIPVDSDKPKGDGDIDSPLPGDSPVSVEGQDPVSGVSPGVSTSTAKGLSAQAVPAEGSQNAGSKRMHTSSDDESRPAKHPKTRVRKETIVYCV